MKIENIEILKLAEIANLSAGYPFRKKIPETDTSDIQIIQLKNVDIQQGINWQSCVKTKLTGKKSPYFLQEGDILFSARGGQHAYYIDKAIQQSKCQYIASPHFFVITLNQNYSTKILPKYLTLLLNNKKSKRYIDKYIVGTNTKSISKVNLAELQISIPPISYQQAVIAIADNINQQRQTLENLITNGEQLINHLTNQIR